jgi:cysteinyl-tRNA synthetase
VGHVMMDQQKMSKSQDNYWLARDFINTFSANTLRLLLLSANYQKPLSISNSIINSCAEKMKQFELTLKKARLQLYLHNLNRAYSVSITSCQQLLIALQRNLNTAKIFEILAELMHKLNANLSFGKINFQTAI